MPASTTSSLKTKAMFAALGALLAVAALFSLCAGASGLSLWEGLTRPDSAAARILVHIRLPRTLAAVLSGAALAASGAIIQGTNGFIKSEMTPNKVGSVTLQLRDGTCEVAEEHYAEKRMIPEFRQFIRAIDEQDYDFCYKQLEHSLAVNEVLNRARIQAGIKVK